MDENNSLNNIIFQKFTHQSSYLNPYIKFMIRYRYIFFAIAAIGIWADKLYYKERVFVGLYSLIMVLLGLVFSRAWLGILQSLLVTVGRFYAAPDGFPVEMDIFIFQWLSYFAIWFAVSILVKKNIEQKDNLIRITTAFANALDARDKYTAFHSENVARYSELIAREMGLPSKKCNLIRLGAHLHDIGKIGIPEKILNKPSMLTSEEYEIIKGHPRIGFKTVKDITTFKKTGVLDAILFHHEREDGSGYPKGLKSEEIPLTAKIIAVADSFDAIRTKRIYRDQNSVEYAVNEINLNKGKLYDPQVVEAFNRVMVRESVNLFEWDESSKIQDGS